MKLRFLLLLITLMSLVCHKGYADTWTDSNGVTWTYTLSGSNATITKCSKTSGSLAIPNKVNGYTVWRIGSSAFKDCSGLTSVTIPSSVTSIQSSAFRDCTGLTSITMNGVVAILNYAFSGCSGLTSVSIPSSVTSIGEGAFQYCTGLTSVTIPSSVTSIGDNAFSGCSGLTSIKVNSGNTVYDSRNSCNAIIEKSTNTLIVGCKNTVIPNTVTSIGSSAFKGCTGLTSVTIPSSVTSIGVAAFLNCTGLTSVTIPSSVTSIGDNAFSGCSGLTSITVASGNTVYDSRDNCNAIIETATNTLVSGCKNTVIPNSVTSIGGYAFYNCSNLTSVTIPSSVTSIGGYAFYNCSNLTSVTVEMETPLTITSNTFSNRANATLYVPAGCKTAYYSANYWDEFKQIVEISPIITFADANVKAICVQNWDTDGDGELSETEAAAVTNLGTVFKSNRNVTTFNELQYFTGLTSIGSAAFRFSSLTSITIPNSVTSIEDLAFDGCSSLTSFTIPNSVMSISTWAFSDCSSLTSITIPTSVSNIDFGVFNGCTSLTTITVASGNTKYDSRNNCNAIIEKSTNTLIAGCKNTVIPSNVTCIGVEAFKKCTSLTSITIPTSVTSIGDSAFEGCSGLTSITIPSSVTSIGDNAFEGCSGLTSIIIPTSVTSIGVFAFNGCSGLTSVTIGSSVTAINHSTFRGCSNLTTITIPNGVTSIGSYAFYSCSRLTSVTIPNSVTSIGDNAFNFCSSLTSVTIENPTPVTITSTVFSNRTNATLYVPYGSKSVYQSAVYWKQFKSIIEVDNRPEQSLSFSGIPTKTYGDAAISLPSTTDEGQTLGWGSSNESVATISNKLLTITGAGTATIVAYQPGNNSYKPFTKTYTLTVKKAPLTITAKSYTITQGDALPTFEATYSGFKNNETASVLTTQPSFSCTATSSSVPGAYTITPSGAAAANYTFTYVNGTLTIMGNQAVNLTQIPAQTYGATTYNLPEKTNAGLTITWSSSNTNVATVSGHTLTIKNAGTATITATQAGNSNYNSFSKTYTLTVNKAPLTVTAKSYTITQGDALPTFEATYSGFKNNETASVLTTQPSFSCTATSSSAPGAYTITPSGATAANYTFTYVNGTLTIMGNQTVNLTQIPAQTYGAATYNLPEKTNAGLTITWSSSNTNVATVSGHTLTIKNAGTATITATQAGNSNYNSFSKTYTLTVNKAPLTVTAKSYTITQGDAMPTFEVEYDGFKNDETADDLTSQPTISCTASDTYTEGIYDITVSGAASDNYDISYVAGKLTVAPTDAHITITSAGMGTYCSPYDLDFTGVTDLKAYTITGYDKANSRVYATRVYDVPAGTGLYLVGNPGDYDVPISTSNSYYINMLVGTLEQTWIDTTDGDLTNLRLTGTNPSNASFKILSEGRNFSANRAYLQIPTYILGNTANAATAFGIVLDDDTNGIEDIMLSSDDTDSEWYTLDGRKLNGKPTARGIYVVKGRKVVVK